MSTGPTNQTTAAARLRQHDAEIEAGGTDVNFWPHDDICAVLAENDRLHRELLFWKSLVPPEIRHGRT